MLGKQLGSTSRANKLLKAFETATVKTEDRAVGYLSKDYNKNAVFMVKSGKDCKDDVDCCHHMLPHVSRVGVCSLLPKQGKSKKKSLKVLADYIGDSDLIFRNVALFSLRKLAERGDSTAVRAIKAALKRDEERVKAKKNKYKAASGALKLALAQYED